MQRKKNLKSENSVRTLKCKEKIIYVHYGGARKRRKRDMYRKSFKEVITGNHLNLGNECDTLMQKAQRASNKILSD